MHGNEKPQSREKRETHDDMVAAGLLQHVRDELRGDGSAALVLLVLTGIGEQGDDRGNALRARDLAGVDHNAHLHERGVHLPAARVDDVHIVLPHGLLDVDVCFADSALLDLGAAEWDAQTVERSQREGGGRRNQRKGQSGCEPPGTIGMYRRAMISASSGWLVPAQAPTHVHAVSSAIDVTTQPRQPDQPHAPVNILIPLPVNMMQNVHETKKEIRIGCRKGKEEKGRGRGDGASRGTVAIFL